jgi:orotate phosphoribosyltransferase
VVVEDLVSTGGSSFEAIEALKAEGMTIAGVVCIFHYGFAQTLQKFAENKVECKSLTNFSILLERSLHSQYISGDDFTKLKSWNLNPKAWSDQFQSSL